MSKIIRFILLSLLLMPLSGCKKDDNKVTSFMVERTNKSDYYHIEYDEFVKKCENKDQFATFVYSEFCSSCHYLKEGFLDSFVKKNNLRIYSLCIDGVNDLSYIGNISKNFKDDSFYSFSKDNKLILYYPLMLLISDEQVVSYQLGANKINQNYFGKTFYFDVKSEVYSPKLEEVLYLNKIENPEFITYENQVEKGLIYHTKETKSDELTYYIKPLMDEYKINIYLDYNQNYQDNSLEIVNQDFSISSNNKKDYFALAKSYLRTN